MSEKPTNYARIARRIRVPLTFVLAGVCFWFSDPTWDSIATGAVIMFFGLLLRARAAGHVQKDKVLTVTGPYAYTRNPLYLGSILLALGFASAARNFWIGVALIALFLVIYWPLIKAEEAYLRATFPGFDEYARVVPRLLTRFTPARLAGAEESGSFSIERYKKHREYNAIIGAVVILAALSGKILWATRVTH